MVGHPFSANKNAAGVFFRQFISPKRGNMQLFRNHLYLSFAGSLPKPHPPRKRKFEKRA
jgi:hypothetical protein